MLSVLLAISALAVDPAPPSTGKIPVLILSGRNNHDWRTTTPRLAQILEQTGRFDVRITHDPSTLTSAALAPYQVLVSDYNGPRLGEIAEKAIEDFIRSGRGFAAIHAASYAFGDMEILGDKHVRTGIREQPWPTYAQMLGTRWSADPPPSGHGKRHLFQVKFTDPSHPIASKDDGFTISDELYHNLRMSPAVHVLATAFDALEINGTGKDEPISWTNAFGKGRVFYTALGHDVEAMSAPGFSAMFSRAVQWAAGSQ
jgi:type 1 glutamine amidotransferase